jgi:hypothetical protein
MSKFNWWMRACGAFLLWTAAAIATPAQKVMTVQNFDGMDGVRHTGELRLKWRISPSL